MIVCGEQEKLGRNIYENASLITSPTAITVSIVENPAVTTANILKLDTETSTEVHLTQVNLLNIGQAQRTGNPVGPHIAADLVPPHTENPVETTANGHKLDTETSIVEVTAVLPDTQDPVDSTANLRTLDLVEITVADRAVLPGTQDPVVSKANLRTLDPVVSIVADQAVLHDTQDPVDSTANHRTLDPAVSIVAEAVLRNMRDRIAKGVASTAQNVDSLRK